MGAAFCACLAAAAGVSADEPAPEGAAVEPAPAAPDLAPEPAAEPPTELAVADPAGPKQPKAAAVSAPIKTNREAIALLYGFAFGLALIALSSVARFRRDMFGRSAG